MEKEKIIDYINKRGIITMPAIQKRFSLSYHQTKELFSELIDEGRLVFASDITYNVSTEDKKMPESDIKQRQRFNLSEYMRMRGMFRSEETADEDDSEDDDDTDYDETKYDDDDDEDDDEETRVYDRLRESVREKIERESIDDGGDKSDDSIVRMRARIGNLSKLFSIKRIFNDCINQRVQSECMNNELGNVISLNNGEKFKLNYDEGILKIAYDCFAPFDCTSAMRADTIIKEYKSLSYESGQIVANVKNNSEVLDVLLELYAAVERIKHGG